MTPGRSESLFRKRVRKFRRLKRGYYSFVLILSAYAFSFLLPFLMSGTPLAVRHDGRYFFPMFRFYSVTDFGVEGFGGGWTVGPEFEADLPVERHHEGHVHLLPTTRVGVAIRRRF